MKIAILGPWDFNRLSATMEKLITESNCFLFTVVCGGTSEKGLENSIGRKWAIQNGAPLEFLVEENPDRLINKLVNKIDFVVALDDGSSMIKRIIMKMSMEGKHGRVEKQ